MNSPSKKALDTAAKIGFLKGACAGVVAVLLPLAVIFLCLLLMGCASTVTPRMVTDAAPSWDGTNQNSGFVAYAADGQGIITANARARYNGLIVTYGARFVPPLQADAGLTQSEGGKFLIDQQHLAYFEKMNRWRKQALGAPK